MWPYASRGSRFLDKVDARSPSRLGDRAFHTNEAVIKLWLPDRLLAAIDALCTEYDASRPDVLRWILFEHVYGRVEFAHLRRKARDADRADIAHSRSGRVSERLSPRAVTARLLGKSVLDVKLFLPAPLRDALQDLAAERQQALSDYLRQVLSRQLLGEQFFREWQRALPGVHQEARRHEGD